MLEQRALTEEVIGLAIGVHRETGPGLLESFYVSCLCLALEEAGLPFQTQVLLPGTFRGRVITQAFRADIVVSDAVIVEVKALALLVPAHEFQLRTYLRVSGIRVGLLMNFHARRLGDGLQRFIV